MRRYEIVEGYSIAELEHGVRLLLDKGFEPAGGLTVKFRPSEVQTLYYQAMYYNGR